MATPTPPPEPSPPRDSVEVRDQLVEALRLDLVGPWSGHPLETEQIPNYTGIVRPSNWYLTGFIVPPDTAASEAANSEVSDDLDETPDKAGTAEESSDEGRSAKRGYFPSSIGLSFMIDGDTTELAVTVRWGDYAPEQIDETRLWSRIPREELTVIKVPTTENAPDWEIPGSRGLKLRTVTRQVAPHAQGAFDPGSQAVSVFLTNHRKQQPGQDVHEDTLFVFQPEIEVRCDRPFPSKPMARSGNSDDWDEEVAGLHYADTPEYATGHGVSADWDEHDGECRIVRTAWIGRARVEVTSTSPVDGVELSMRSLGSLSSGAEVHSSLDHLVAQYRAWIEARNADTEQLDEHYKATAQELLRLAGIAADRIERGIEVLANDPDALDAFRIANRAVARALEQRLDIENPSWRAFQLAFILLNLPGIADPNDSYRETVDLLFFPTGGGKTEAYLGLAAFAMVLRRLRNPGSQGCAGAGISVVMRYTLRLLTLDQLARASGLVCALELERENDPERYGKWPFEIGLWVGTAATPNRMGKKGDGRQGTARSKVNQFKSDPANNPSPIPLEECPWCGETFAPDSFNLVPNADNPLDLRVHCMNFECEFSGERTLPVVAVDEPLYRRLPAFLVATVDKFASLPWTGPTGSLLGGADRFDKDGFYGAFDSGRGNRLHAPLQPPDLIIQDELHLISGPLGTMAGLYEAAVEALCVLKSGNQSVRPKIVASTATVRRAQNQIQALFARPQTQIFPPPGPDRHDTFFARTVPDTEEAARLYLGISAQGRSAKVVTRRVIVALMGAAIRAYLDAGGDDNQKNPADPYMTVLGYFNALRELGGARRIIEEEVQNTIKRIGRKRRFGETRGLFRDRFRFSEVVELTSRVSTNKVAEARRLLGNPYRIKLSPTGKAVDCAIATNMISVGLDIQRLGLMTVVGQPKTAAEYIQATSRVGRDPKRPGLVVTLLNMHKPRDRSHYERFKHFHETFYRAVEVASVTPFASRALDRGLAGALVGLSRQALAPLTPPSGASQIKECRAEVEELIKKVFSDRILDQPGSMESEDERAERLRSVRDRVEDLLDAWSGILSESENVGQSLQYQKHERRGASQTLLREMMDEDIANESHHKFRASRSLRDVEPEVRLNLIES